MATLFASFEPRIPGLTIIPKDRVTLTEVGGEVQDIVRAQNGTISSVLLKTSPELQTVFSAFVSDSADDASETAGVVTLTGTTLAFVVANTIGVRFVNVNVPVGATIVSAVLTFTAIAIKNPYTVITVRGEAEPDPPAFTTGANDITDRTVTINASTWVPDAWAVDDENSIDVAAIVAEIIAIGGWAALNAMAFVLTSVTGSDREARSFDDDPTKAPKLTVTFEAPAPPFISQEVVTLAKGEKAKVSLVSFP